MAREVAFGARDTAGPPNPSAWSNAAQNSAARVVALLGLHGEARVWNTASTASGTATPSVRGVGRRSGLPDENRAARCRRRRARVCP
jgi:hypothetical protein